MFDLHDDVWHLLLIGGAASIVLVLSVVSLGGTGATYRSAGNVGAAFAAPVTAESVTCVFLGSDAFEECYAGDEGACLGKESCSADVSGRVKSHLLWQSSCGGHGYTIMDGRDEHITFRCNNYK